MRPHADALLVESLSNPTLRVADLALLAGVARRHGSALIVDSTLATPVNLQPAAHGATLVVHSATKALNGHGDVTAGAVAGSGAVLARVRDAADGLGACLDPGAASLLERGLRTLVLRVEHQNEVARMIAAALVGHAAVAAVVHPSLPSHPDFERAGHVLGGTAGLVTLRLRGGAAAANRFLAALDLIGRAPTLGGLESLAMQPWVGSHAALPPAERRRAGVRPGMIRLSLGIEDPAELLTDLEGGLLAAARARARGDAGVSASVTIVLPALDEAASIERVVAGLTGRADEIVVVDNGSNDGTGALAASAGARVVHEPQRGFGAACYAGAVAARGDVVCFLDADGTFAPADVTRVVDEVVTGRLGLCLGSRTLGASGIGTGHRLVEPRSRPRARRHRCTAPDRHRAAARAPSRRAAVARGRGSRVRVAARDGDPCRARRPRHRRDAGRLPAAPRRHVEGHRLAARIAAGRAPDEQPARP